jgi:hypothetical protein
VDVKTLLLLGAGMVVLSLVGFCSVQSRSAGFVVAGAPIVAFEAISAELPPPVKPPTQPINAGAYLEDMDVAAASQGVKR